MNRPQRRAPQIEGDVMAQTIPCPACGGPLPREVFCRACGVGCCSAVCEAAHFAAAHLTSAATVSISGEEPTPDGAVGPATLTGLTSGMPIRLANGARGVVLRCFPDRGTVRVLYRLGNAELEGLFTPDELTRCDAAPSQ